MNGTAQMAFTRPPEPKRQCKVCDILGKIDGDLAARAKDALDAGMAVWPHSAVADTFGDLGFVVSDHSVRVHRLRCS